MEYGLGLKKKLHTVLKALFCICVILLFDGEVLADGHLLSFDALALSPSPLKGKEIVDCPMRRRAL